MKRIFIAVKIKLTEETISLIGNIKAKLQNENIKWVKLNDVHITLKFLGDTQEDNILNMSNALLPIINKIQVFQFDLIKIGVFKNISQPRVLWMGIKNKDNLQLLNKNIEDTLDNLGFEKSKQNYSPHLTLGRIKFLKNKNILKEILDGYTSKYFQSVQVNEIIVYESLLTPTGSVYKEIHKIELKKNL